MKENRKERFTILMWAGHVGINKENTLRTKYLEKDKAREKERRGKRVAHRWPRKVR